VTLTIQPGIAITGSAVSDVVHLLAEIIENATNFSAQHTTVQVSAQHTTVQFPAPELATEGVLIEVSDSGVGIPQPRLAEINSRFENLPVIDVSVSRHMGLFAAGRLAERHGVRLRLRARSPHGLTALIWLPASVTERQARPVGWWPGGQYGPRAVAAIGSESGDQLALMRSASAGSSRDDAVVPAYASVTTPESGPAATPATSDWFHRDRSHQTVGSGNNPPRVDSQEGGDRWSGTETSLADSRQAAQIVAYPVRGDDTPAGLPRRVPLANLLPGSAGGGRHAATAGTRRRADSADAQAAAVARPRRSPEMARKRLSGFQSGSRRAEGQSPREQGGSSR
jgi:histidine kinase/DNA gyrase B/HSP90-like ATPase